MSRFIESICCLDGNSRLLDLHQSRVNRTFAKFFPGYKPIALSELIQDVPREGKFKCRVEYGACAWEVEFLPYRTPEIQKVRVLHSDSISYAYKSADRNQLDQLFAQRGDADDIVIIKNGLVTDSYFANLAFFDGNNWWTPSSPLLNGIKRKQLISQGLLSTRELRLDELARYQKVSMINAMLDLGEVEVVLG